MSGVWRVTCGEIRRQISNLRFQTPDFSLGDRAGIPCSLGRAPHAIGKGHFRVTLYSRDSLPSSRKSSIV